MTNQNLAEPECRIEITHGSETVVVLSEDLEYHDVPGPIEIILPILSRGVGGAKFKIQNFNAAYTGAIAKNDPISIILRRKGESWPPIFGGRITKLTNMGTPPEYWIDVEAMDYGQQLQNPPVLVEKWYNGVLGKTILKEMVDLCPDLSSTTIDEAGDIASTHNLGCDEVLPWTVIKELCDAVVCTDGVKGVDGYVNAGGEVVIFERGKNTSPVSLTDKVLNYTKSDDVYRVKNSKIRVYSTPPKVNSPNQPTIIPGHAYPSNHDIWTEPADDANWIETDGAIDWPIGSPKIGSAYLRFTKAFLGNGAFRRMHDPVNCLAKGGFKSINFWMSEDPLYDHYHVRLLAPDITHYFETFPIDPSATWILKSLWFGSDYEYNADTNPQGLWNPVNSPNWTDIRGIQFYGEMLNTQTFSVDGLYYGNAPYQAETDDTDAEAAASIASYGARTMEPTTVGNLGSDYDCLLWAKGLRSYYVNPATSIKLRTFGDYLFTPGDMQPLVLANDAINDSFRTLEIVHTLNDVWWETVLTLSNEPLSMDYWVRAMWEKQRRMEANIGKF